MITLPCPACGAEIQFKSSISVFGVCSYCSSMVVRHDMNLEELGKMAQLPADMSVIQVGTRGRFDGKSFEVVGRLKIGWEDGNWNEWYVLFDDGRDGWLAEAQGQFMMSFAEGAGSIPLRSAVSAGQVFALLKGQNFEVDDIKNATCVGSEGELPFRGPKGRKSLSVDLTGADQKFACLDYSDDGPRLYIGRYVDFDDLKLTSLRKIDGW